MFKLFDFTFRLFFTILTGLTGAAVLHIVIVFALPLLTPTSVINRLAASERYNNRFGMVEGGQLGTSDSGASDHGTSDTDPFLRTAVCVFEIKDAPFRFTAEGNVPFWSMTLFDAGSNEIFSVNDRTVYNGNLDLVAGTSGQIKTLKRALPSTFEQSLLIPMDDGKAYAVLRVLVTHESFMQKANDFLANARCTETEL